MLQLIPARSRKGIKTQKFTFLAKAGVLVVPVDHSSMELAEEPEEATVARSQGGWVEVNHPVGLSSPHPLYSSPQAHLSTSVSAEGTWLTFSKIK